MKYSKSSLTLSRLWWLDTGQFRGGLKFQGTMGPPSSAGGSRGIMCIPLAIFFMFYLHYIDDTSRITFLNNKDEIKNKNFLRRKETERSKEDVLFLNYFQHYFLSFFSCALNTFYKTRIKNLLPP